MSTYSSLVERDRRAHTPRPILLIARAGERIVAGLMVAMQHLLRAMHESNRRKAEQILMHHRALIQPDRQPGADAER